MGSLTRFTGTAALCGLFIAACGGGDTNNPPTGDGGTSSLLECIRDSHGMCLPRFRGILTLSQPLPGKTQTVYAFEAQGWEPQRESRSDPATLPWVGCTLVRGISNATVQAAWQYLAWGEWNHNIFARATSGFTYTGPGRDERENGQINLSLPISPNEYIGFEAWGGPVTTVITETGVRGECNGRPVPYVLVTKEGPSSRISLHHPNDTPDSWGDYAIPSRITTEALCPEAQSSAEYQEWIRSGCVPIPFCATQYTELKSSFRE